MNEQEKMKIILQTCITKTENDQIDSLEQIIQLLSNDLKDLGSSD